MVHQRSAALAGSAAISAQGQRALSRAASLSASADIAAEGSVPGQGIVQRAAALEATAAIAAAGEVPALNPLQVQNVVVTTISSSSLLVEWDALDSYEYEVERDGAIIARVSINEYLDSGLDPDTTYAYRVRGVLHVPAS
jgi:hypothetical protein